LKEFSENVVGKDISSGHNFLDETEKYDSIITNPPFSLAYEFIQKAKTLTDYFAFLLPPSYLHGKKGLITFILTQTSLYQEFMYSLAIQC